MDELFTKFQKYIDCGFYPGVEWKINFKGKTFKNRVGYADLSTQSLLQENSLYRIWSMTKPIVSIAILQLIDENIINLEDPINIFLPKFNDLKVLKNESSTITEFTTVKNMPTIKDLLLHTAGFSYNFLDDEVGKEYEKNRLFHSPNSSLEEEIDKLSSIPLLFEPSKKWNYSVATDVLGRILEVVLKDNLQNILEKKIFKPLEMNDTSFSLSKQNQKRLMTSYEYNAEQKKLTDLKNQKISLYGYPINNSNYARGGHGLYSTADDYLSFAQMLLTGKSKNGEIILSEKILKLATSNLLDNQYFPLEIPIPGNENADNDLEPYGWGLGFRVLINLDKCNNFGSLGEFGWGGAAATYFLVDPKNDLTAVIMTQVLGALPNLKNDFIETIYSNIN